MSTNAKEVIQHEGNEVLPIVSPDNLLALAIEKGADLDQLEKLMDMKERWEKGEARKAYFLAVSDFKAAPIVITKDKVNKQYASRYTSKGNLVNTVNVVLSKFELNARWDVSQQDDEITVTCILSHAQGHSEQVSLSGPPDDSGSKNSLQQIKSTKTYLEIATYEAVIGVASTDDPGDTDGNLPVQTINADQVANLEALIKAVGAKKNQFLKMLKVKKLSELPALKYTGAIKRLEEKGKAN